MFMASSVSILRSSTSAVDKFIEKANVPDYLAMMFENKTDEDKLVDWMNDSDIVDDYSKEDMIHLTRTAFTLANGKTLEFNHTIVAETNPDKYSVLYTQEDKTFDLKKGEISMPLAFRDQNDIELGDKITITYAGQTFEYTVAAFTKDALFGSAMMGIKRVTFCEEDFRELYNATDVKRMAIYYIQSGDKEQVGRDIAKLGIATVFDCSSSLVKTGYIMDALSAAVLMIVSICMLLISFFIMKFTITQTIINDFREIGVMKAIGLSSHSIRNIYLVKYVGLSVLGAVMGFLLSIPFGDALLATVSANIIADKAKDMYFLNFLCALLVVVIVLLFCYKCSGRIKKFSVIEAIRNGNSGERYRTHSGLRLSRKKTRGVTFYLAGNDILSSMRKYLSLSITFILGALLFIIPVNAVNTLGSDSTVELLDRQVSDVYLDNDDVFSGFLVSSNKAEITDKLNEISDTAAQHGLDMVVSTAVSLTTVIKGGDGSIKTINGSQGINVDYSKYKYIDGTGPLLDNEIAVTEKTLDYFDVGIGDKLTVKLGNVSKDYIICGTYASFSNMGYEIRFSENADVDYNQLNGLFGISGNYKDTSLSASEVRDNNEKLAEVLPDYKIMNSQQLIAKSLGDIVNQFANLRKIILMLVICIDILITVLMLRNFIIQEQDEIAMLKSIGLTNGKIRLRYTLRISILLISSMLIAILLSLFINRITILPIFSYMGATSTELSINYLEVYIMYPAIILAVTTFAAFLSTSVIKKISVKDLNNVE